MWKTVVRMVTYATPCLFRKVSWIQMPTKRKSQDTTYLQKHQIMFFLAWWRKLTVKNNSALDLPKGLLLRPDSVGKYFRAGRLLKIWTRATFRIIYTAQKMKFLLRISIKECRLWLIKCCKIQRNNFMR